MHLFNWLEGCLLAGRFLLKVLVLALAEAEIHRGSLIVPPVVHADIVVVSGALDWAALITVLVLHDFGDVLFESLINVLEIGNWRVFKAQEMLGK